MRLPLKGGEEVEVPQDWIDEWNKVYYDVPRTLADIRMWCLDNPEKRKTKRGLRAFLGRWIRKSCVVRPLAQVEVRQTRIEERPSCESVVPLEARVAHLAKIKGMLTK